ncbi:hypothetical protein VFPPC_11499 [Pochonia chlamydosporia 170]|uniref:Uncharacterized protein n=1 Tax=Pochonia chlamydosporia 170 TaxID=1380566 RepID=A0A179F0Q0_METCM|nr:hypothetical protein VFPPC_11499 [Pochonia chlamydosporia 170]OAQ59001.1 hypothetical protein VFPPC_11499 [Pochonia chlamydosporia 170]
MLSRLCSMLQPPPAEDETVHPLDFGPLRAPGNATKTPPQTHHARSGLNLPPPSFSLQEEKQKKAAQHQYRQVLDEFAETSHKILREIDSLAAEMEQLRHATEARSKPLKPRTARSPQPGGTTIAQGQAPQAQRDVEEQVQVAFR